MPISNRSFEEPPPRAGCVMVLFRFVSAMEANHTAPRRRRARDRSPDAQKKFASLGSPENESATRRAAWHLSLMSSLNRQTKRPLRASTAAKRQRRQAEGEQAQRS